MYATSHSCHLLMTSVLALYLSNNKCLFALLEAIFSHNCYKSVQCLPFVRSNTFYFSRNEPLYTVCSASVEMHVMGLNPT